MKLRIYGAGCFLEQKEEIFISPSSILFTPIMNDPDPLDHDQEPDQNTDHENSRSQCITQVEENMNCSSSSSDISSTGGSGSTIVPEDISYRYPETSKSPQFTPISHLKVPVSRQELHTVSPVTSLPSTVRSKRSGMTARTAGSGMLVRPERRVPTRSILEDPPTTGKKQYSAWDIFVISLTICVRPWCLTRCCKKNHPDIQHAWREKIALCFICVCCTP